MMTYSDGPALIGKKDTNYDAPPWFFKGTVDDLMIFKGALSEDDIKLMARYSAW